MASWETKVLFLRPACRFRYLDSKYNAGDALTDVITVRAYAKGNITVTPYADVYAAVRYGSWIM